MHQSNRCYCYSTVLASNSANDLNIYILAPIWMNSFNWSCLLFFVCSISYKLQIIIIEYWQQCRPSKWHIQMDFNFIFSSVFNIYINVEERCANRSCLCWTLMQHIEMKWHSAHAFISLNRWIRVMCLPNGILYTNNVPSIDK